MFITASVHKTTAQLHQRRKILCLWLHVGHVHCAVQSRMFHVHKNSQFKLAGFSHKIVFHPRRQYVVINSLKTMLCKCNKRDLYSKLKRVHVERVPRRRCSALSLYIKRICSGPTGRNIRHILPFKREPITETWAVIANLLYNNKTNVYYMLMQQFKSSVMLVG